MLRRLIYSTAAAALIGYASAAPFTPGNVVIYRVGTGGATVLVNTGNPVFLDEYTPGGTLVQSIPMPTVVNGVQKRLVASGTANNDGLMTRSTDGRYLIVPGYDAALPQAVSITTTTSAAVPRVIGRVDAAGSVDTSTALTDAESANNFRSACSDNGARFWSTGGGTGVRYISGVGATVSTQLNATLLNFRQSLVVNGQLYVSSSSGAVRLGTVGTGTPTTASQSITSLAGYPTTGANPCAYYFCDLNAGVAGLDTLYVADDGGTTGGILKYSYDGTTWTSRGLVGVATDGYRGLTGTQLGSKVTLFITRSANALASLIDNSGSTGTLTGTPTLLATAATNTAFRGIALSPQAILPDLVVSSVSAPANASTGTNFSYTLTVGNVGTVSASGVATRFTLPAGLSFVSASGTNGFTAAHSSGVVDFTGGTLAVSAEATLTVTVSTATAATYTVANGAAVMDPSAGITESLESNNSSSATTSTIVTMPNTPPSFTTQPANASIGNGATATLTSLAAGSPTPSYQWYQGNSGDTSAPISGAMSSSFTTPALFVNASYWVRATNTQGTADSSTAAVAVAASNNAALSALTVGTQILEPTFAADKFSYTTILGNSTASISLSASVAMSYASMTVNGSPLTSGGSTAALPLSVGPNNFSIVVTAQDGSTTASYTVNVFRSAPTLPVGSIAFVGYNADGTEDIAFVALTDLPDHSVIHFADNEWNGGSIVSGGTFTDFLESEFAWIPPAGGILAGSVVVINGISVKDTATTSTGSLVFTDGGDVRRGFSAIAETVYAFMGGTRAPSGFLAAINTDSAGILSGTGLGIGSTAVNLTTGSNGAIYIGTRTGQASYASYLSLIGTVNVTNWNDVQEGLGTNLLPFSTASFSLIGSPIYTHSNRDVLNPNRDVWTSAGVMLNGLQFINLGLQGVGRIPSSQLDSVTGESIGSLSDMQISGFTNNGNGSYSGTFHFLPDGGYRGGSTNPNFAARINAFTFTFTPYTSATTTTAQNQVAMTFTGSTRFTYDHDGNSGTPAVFTTGLTPTGVGTLLSGQAPVYGFTSSQSDGAVSNRLCVTGEGLVLDKRAGKTGTGWVSDEFSPAIFHFNSSKRLDGRVSVPIALVPHSPVGTTDFATANPVNGRRENQGIEGLAQSPDGTRLFAMMQSATEQDAASGNEGRFNARVLVYDISSTDTPSSPIAQYVFQLPRIDDTGITNNGTTVTRTGGQSSILALNNNAFLVLSRDGNGRGTAGVAPVFKSILLADLSSATNISSSYDAEAAAVAPNAVLQPGITPVTWTQALNLIGGLSTVNTEVAKFSLNINAGDGTTNTLSDKWEATSLVPCGDVANPNDFFLFLGNDNNFQTTAGKVMTAAGTLANYNAGLAHDSMVLAYRVRIVAPGIAVTQSSTSLTDTVTTVDFGSTAVSSPAPRSFTVQNTGTSQLTGLSISIDGTDAASFSVTASPSAPLSSADTTSFTVQFLPTSAGSKSATLHLTSNAAGSLASFDIPLTGTATSPISSWRQTYFGTSANTGNAADTADFDQDGVVNLLEYALGILPDNGLGSHGLPALPTGSTSQAAPVLAGRLSFQFETAETTPSDVTYTVQSCDDMASWTDLASKTGAGPWTWLAGGSSRILTQTQAGRTTVQVGDSQPATQPRRMMRLRVTR